MLVRTVTHGLIRVLQSAARQWTDQWSRWSKFTRMVHRYGRATSAAFSGSVVFTLATTES
jgi:hypothetical protein